MLDLWGAVLFAGNVGIGTYRILNGDYGIGSVLIACAAGMLFALIAKKE